MGVCGQRGLAALDVTPGDPTMMGLCTVAAIAALSSPPQDLPPSLAFPLPERVLFDEVDGVHWALGHTYKASIGTEGLSYWPLQGPHAAGAVRLGLELKRVLAGGRELPLKAPEVARGQLPNDDTRHGSVDPSVSIRRGVVIESYRFDLTSVEQMFRIDLNEVFPGERGALSLEVSMTSNELKSNETRPPFSFHRRSGVAMEPLVQIGRAFSVSASGHLTPLDARRTEGGSGYVIEVPASVVREAGDVLTIDPVISSGLVTESNLQQDVIADVASVGDEYFVAVERQVNPGDNDISIYRVGRSGPLQATFLAAVDFTNSLYSEPAISGLAGSGDLMVASTRGSGVSRRIYLRRFTTGGATLSSNFSAWNLSLEAFEADLGAETGGGSSTASGRYCLVFTEVVFGQSGTVALILERDGSVAAGPLYLDGLEQAAAPAVSNGTGRPLPLAPQAFRVAQKRIDAGNAESVWAAEISRNGDMITQPWKVADTQNTTRVTVASANEARLEDGSSPYIVAWDGGLVVQGDIQMAMCVGGAVRGDVSNIGILSDERRTFDQRRPSLAVTGSHWLMAYQERALPLGDWQTFLCSGGLTERGPGLAERNQRLLPSADPQVDVTIATLYDGGVSSSVGDNGLVIWTNMRTGGAIEGARVVPPAFGVAGVQYCSANRNSTGLRAWVTADGDGSVASTHAIRCLDGPPAAPCYVLTSRSTAFVQNVGGGSGNLCLGGAGFGRFATDIGSISASGEYTLTFDPGAIAQPNGSVAALPGETWYFQAWFRDAGSGGAATSNLSNGVAIEFTL
ncbi:MAG: hypothetical protein AAGG01_05385 [Planctomycetota bacterium]